MSLLRLPDDILFMAFRYALGRMTGAPSEVAKEIRLHMHRIEADNLLRMSKEIIEARDRAVRGGHDALGMDIDRKLWLELLIDIQEELAKRKKQHDESKFGATG